jgi:hypothetical protein
MLFQKQRLCLFLVIISATHGYKRSYFIKEVKDPQENTLDICASVMELLAKTTQLLSLSHHLLWSYKQRHVNAFAAWVSDDRGLFKVAEMNPCSHMLLSLASKQGSFFFVRSYCYVSCRCRKSCSMLSFHVSKCWKSDIVTATIRLAEQKGSAEQEKLKKYSHFKSSRYKYIVGKKTLLFYDADELLYLVQEIGI